MHPVHYSQAVAVNAGSMVTSSGQVITATTNNFPQQMISTVRKPVFMVNQPRFAPANANQRFIFPRNGAPANQQTVFNYGATINNPKEKVQNMSNQLVTMQTNSHLLPQASFYVSSLPVNSISQVLNGNQITGISSQAQMVTPQVSDATLNQAQLLGMQPVQTLLPGLSWTHPGLQLYQNPVIIYNPQPGMRPTMQLPVAAVPQPIASASFTSPTVAPPMNNGCNLKVNRVLSTSVPQQRFPAVCKTDSSQVKIVNHDTIASAVESKPVSIETKVSLAQNSQAKASLNSNVSQAYMCTNTSPSNTQLASTDACVKQLQSASLAQQMFHNANPTDPNSGQIVDYKIMSSGNENKPSSIEAENSSLQNSQPLFVPNTSIPQSYNLSNPAINTMSPSSLAINSSTFTDAPSSNAQLVTTDACVGQVQSTCLTQQMFVPVNTTDPNSKHIINEKAVSSGLENKTQSIEAKISLPQNSETTVVPNSNVLPAYAVSNSAIDTVSPSTLTIESSTCTSALPSSTSEIATADTCVKEVSSIPSAQQMLITANATDPNSEQIVNDETESFRIEDKEVCAKIKISSSQKSQAIVTAASNNWTCLTTTSTVDVSAVSMAPSPLTVQSTMAPPMITSSIQVDTSVPSVDTISSMVSNTSPDYNSNPSFSETFDKAVVAQNKTNSAETAITTENSKLQFIEQYEPEQLDQQLTSKPFKAKQKAIVQPRVLTHVIDGFIIQESSEPFPVTPSALLTSYWASSNETLTSPEKSQDISAVPNSERKKRLLRSKDVVELSICEFCAKSGSDFTFLHKKNFCSKSCAKQYKKQIPRKAKAIQGHVNSVSNSERKKRLIRSKDVEELSTCELCGKSGSHFGFLHKKRFCSKYCAKQYNKHTPGKASTIQEHVNSGLRGRKRKKRRGRPPSRKQENSNAAPVVEIPSTDENESSVLCKNIEESSRIENSSHVSYMRKEENFISENTSIFLSKTGEEKCAPEKYVSENIAITSYRTEEWNSAPETESTVSYETVEENLTPSNNLHPTPMELDVSNDEVEKTKSNLSQKLPSKWTVQEVFEFIKNIPGCSDSAENFKSHEIDGQALLLLTDEHLTTAMYMKLGPAVKLVSQIKSMEEELKSQL